MALPRGRSQAQVVTVPTDEDFADPLANPEKANADIAAALSDSTHVTMPAIDIPPDDLVELPGGLVKGERVIKTATVRELTGKDEEALARASQSMNIFHFFDRLLTCGVIKLGDEPASDTEKLLREMLIGDRDAIILGIRKATYGSDIEIESWKCISCGQESSLSMDISDIPVKKIIPEADRTFEVPMRKGGHAEVRLANGQDQIEIMEKKDLTQAQVETLFLTKCVISIVDAHGFDRSMQGFPSMSLELSVPDRHAILKELGERQPGPKYDQVEYECESCGKKGMVVVGIGDLFLDFGWV